MPKSYIQGYLDGQRLIYQLLLIMTLFDIIFLSPKKEAYNFCHKKYKVWLSSKIRCSLSLAVKINAGGELNIRSHGILQTQS